MIFNQSGGGGTKVFVDGVKSKEKEIQFAKNVDDWECLGDLAESVLIRTQASCYKNAICYVGGSTQHIYKFEDGKNTDIGTTGLIREGLYEGYVAMCEDGENLIMADLQMGYYYKYNGENFTLISRSYGSAQAGTKDPVSPLYGRYYIVNGKKILTTFWDSSSYFMTYEFSSDWSTLTYSNRYYTSNSVPVSFRMADNLYFTYSGNICKVDVSKNSYEYTYVTDFYSIDGQDGLSYDPPFIIGSDDGFMYIYSQRYKYMFCNKNFDGHSMTFYNCGNEGFFNTSHLTAEKNGVFYILGYYERRMIGGSDYANFRDRIKKWKYGTNIYFKEV